MSKKIKIDLGTCDKNRCSQRAVTVELEVSGEPWPSQLCPDHARDLSRRGSFEAPVKVGPC